MYPLPHWLEYLTTIQHHKAYALLKMVGISKVFLLHGAVQNSEVFGCGADASWYVQQGYSGRATSSQGLATLMLIIACKEDTIIISSPISRRAARANPVMVVKDKNSVDNLNYQRWQNFVGDVPVLHAVFPRVLCAENLLPPQTAESEPVTRSSCWERTDCTISQRGSRSSGIWTYVIFLPKITSRGGDEIISISLLYMISTIWIDYGALHIY